MSKYPFEETNKIVYDSIVQDALAAKGVLHARVNISRTFVECVCDTSSGSLSLSDLRGSQSEKQLQQLCKFVKSTTKNDTSPIIILGDFNIDAFQDEINSLYTYMMKSFGQVDDTNKIRDLIRESHGGKSSPTTVPYLFNKETGEEHCLGSNIETETGPRLPSASFIKDNLSTLSLRPQALDLVFDRGQKTYELSAR